MIDYRTVTRLVENHSDCLNHNHVLLDILEGNLMSYVVDDLKRSLSPQVFEQAMHRIVPINIFPKVIDKLTNIYQTGVVREVVGGSQKDSDLLNWYVESLDINSQLNSANELFNACKSLLLYPYVYNGKPFVRSIENDRFVVYSDNPVNPCHVTDVVLLAGRKNEKDLYWVYSQDGFYAMTSDEKMDLQEMIRVGNPEGENPFGVLPFVYAADSKHKLNPTQDTDTLKVIKVLPIMLTDLNLAAMFQSFSMVYGIDLDDENIVFAPNAFLRFKSDPTKQTQPSIGTIKPEVDFDQVLRLIESELSMWLGTKGIRASTIGALSTENFASGVSKLIDEMDTFEARQKQVSTFLKVEEMFWGLILNYMHPVWVQRGEVENRTLWTPGAKVKTTFAMQLPMQSRGQLVRDLRDEYSSGFITRKRAVAKLNPHMTSREIEELINEIQEERTITSDTINDNELSVTEEKAEEKVQTASSDANSLASRTLK